VNAFPEPSKIVPMPGVGSFTPNPGIVRTETVIVEPVKNRIVSAICFAVLAWVVWRILDHIFRK
jgi:hypothetical protein